MGVLVLNRESESENGLRPLDILRDLDAVGRLINIAFADDIAREGSDMQRDMLLLSAASPLLWTLRRLSADLRDAFDGFVWVEEGKVVGNVTLTREDPGHRVWTISNVAVHPDYRRRGIARALMQACIDTVADRGGGPLVLEVRSDNAAAYDLYKSLSFRYVDGTVTMRRRGRIIEPLPLAGQARRVSSRDLQRLYEFCRAARAPLADQISPLRMADFQPGLMKQITALLSQMWLQEEYIWLGLEERARFVAAARLHLRAFGGSIFTLTMHPDGGNGSEEAIVQSALALCRATDSITVRVASEQLAALATLTHFGFSQVRDLHRLLLVL